MADNRKTLVRERESILSKPTLTAEEKMRIKEINSELATISRRLAALVKVLDKRLSALSENLGRILKSPSLKSLVAIRSQYFDDITLYWHLIHTPIVGYDYSSWQIKQVRTLKRSVREPLQYTKRKIVKYWLDTNISPQPTIDDVYKPEHALRGIESKLWFKCIGKNESGQKVRERYDVRAIMKDAVELEFRHSHLIKQGRVPAILPRTESEAINIYKVKAAISKLKNSISRSTSNQPVASQ